MQQIIQLFIENLIPVGAGGIMGWALYKARSKSIEIDNQQKIIKLYKDALDDLKLRYEERFGELQKEIELLRRNVELWKGKYRDLKKEFENYKKRKDGK